MSEQDVNETVTQIEKTEEHPLVTEISEALAEPNLVLLQVVLDVIGEERTRAFFEKTKEVEAEGGMLIMTGKRRRTAGGVFFYLVRKDVSKDEGKAIFPDFSRASEQIPKQEPPSWKECTAYVNKLLENPQKGDISRAKLTLIGRPKQIAKTKTCMVAILEGRSIPQGMPKGLPQPPDTKPTFPVFIAGKQWIRISDSLRKKPDDELIVEGYPVFDPEKQVTIVLAKSVTTKTIQRGRRKSAIVNK